jgi:hypothetical protein
MAAVVSAAVLRPPEISMRIRRAGA